MRKVLGVLLLLNVVGCGYINNSASQAYFYVESKGGNCYKAALDVPATVDVSRCLTVLEAKQLADKLNADMEGKWAGH